MFKLKFGWTGLAVAVVTATCLVCQSSAALASTCGSNYCAGSDGTTATNQLGNGPQEYLGEVGLYYTDAGGGEGSCSGYGLHDDVCFNPTGASTASQRFENGTGMGVQDYYFGGGADSQYASGYGSPYCFGWWQGDEADYSIYENFDLPSTFILALDIEQNNSFGWSNAYQSQNTQVLSGFVDFITDKSSADPSHCNYGTDRIPLQNAVYSSPKQWSYSFGSLNVPNTYIWTTQNNEIGNSTITWPGTFTGSPSAAWFGGSNHHWAWQWDENPDYDMAYEPDCLPSFPNSPCIGS